MSDIIGRLLDELKLAHEQNFRVDRLQWPGGIPTFTDWVSALIEERRYGVGDLSEAERQAIFGRIRQLREGRERPRRGR